MRFGAAVDGEGEDGRVGALDVVQDSSGGVARAGGWGVGVVRVAGVGHGHGPGGGGEGGCRGGGSGGGKLILMAVDLMRHGR